MALGREGKTCDLRDDGARDLSKPSGLSSFQSPTSRQTPPHAIFCPQNTQHARQLTIPQQDEQNEAAEMPADVVEALKAEVTQQPCVGLHMAMDTRVRRTAYTRTHARAHAW